MCPVRESYAQLSLAMHNCRSARLNCKQIDTGDGIWGNHQELPDRQHYHGGAVWDHQQHLIPRLATTGTPIVVSGAYAGQSMSMKEMRKQDSCTPGPGRLLLPLTILQRCSNDILSK